jgi:hypothetical protein
MALTANQIAVAASKFNGMDDRVIRMSILYLLYLNSGLTMTANQIANAAAKACFNCSDDRSFAVQALYLLNVIAGSGGGGSNPAAGVVNPNGSVSAASGATYYNKANATFWVNQDGTNTGWVQLI